MMDWWSTRHCDCVGCLVSVRLIDLVDLKKFLIFKLIFGSQNQEPFLPVLRSLAFSASRA